MILVGNVGRHLCNFIPEATFQKARRDHCAKRTVHVFATNKTAVVLFHLNKCVGSCFTQDPNCHDDQALAACSLPQTWEGRLA